jgi:hypothetical protein
VRVHLGPKRQGDSSDLDAIYDASRRTLEGAVPLLYGAGFLSDTAFGPAGAAWCYAPNGPPSVQRLVIDWDLYEGGTATWRPEDYGDGAVHIRALPSNTCLVDQQDAIIATNTGRFMGGTYSPGQYAGKQIDLHAMPWRLFVGTPAAGPAGE